MARKQSDRTAVLARTLVDYRATIDNLDAAIVHVLAERFRVTGCVGQLKRDGNLAAADPERETDQLRRLAELARTCGLDPVVVDIVFPPIMAEVRRRHDALRSDESTD